MTSPNSPIDPAALDSLDAIADVLADAFEDGDGQLISAALQAVSQAPALPGLAAAVGLPREQLQAALASGVFDLVLTLEIMKVVDLHMSGGKAG